MRVPRFLPAASVAAVAAALLLPPPSAASPVSAHAEIYTCCTPQPLKERVFSEARAMGASYIRVDVTMSDIFPAPGAPPDWRGLDEVIELSRRHGLRVLAILLETPAWLSSCPLAEKPGICPPRDLAQYASLAGRVAAHARGVINHWQILNEPIYSYAFTGSPEEYARMLTAASDAIKRAAPEDLIVMGNVYVDPAHETWVKRVFATAGARRKYDIAAVNLRAGLSYMASGLHVWRRFLAREGFRGPVWVTEHGYPADEQYQYDPAFADGPAAQARYLTWSLPDLDDSGAAEVFVTLRHRDTDKYVSEGIIDFGAPPGYLPTRLPAFYTVRTWANEWRRRQASYRERLRWHSAQVAHHLAGVADSERLAEKLRAQARKDRSRERRVRRRARKLRAAIRRYARCWERTGSPVCVRRAKRTKVKERRALREAAKLRRRRRARLRKAKRYDALAAEHRAQAAANAERVAGYRRMIKPLI